MTISDRSSQARARDARMPGPQSVADNSGGGAYAVRRTAWILSLSGAIPFATMAALLLYAGREFIAYQELVLAMSGYSAVILSFLGGVRWGTGLAGRSGARSRIVLSIIPPLVGWALLFVPSPWTFAGFAFAFAAAGLWDFVAAQRRTLPRWFGRLRTVITVFVVACEGAAFFSTLQ